MNLDVNICSVCGKRNVNDSDYFPDKLMCRECIEKQYKALEDELEKTKKIEQKLRKKERRKDKFQHFYNIFNGFIIKAFVLFFIAGGIYLIIENFQTVSHILSVVKKYISTSSILINILFTVFLSFIMGFICLGILYILFGQKNHIGYICYKKNAIFPFVAFALAVALGIVLLYADFFFTDNIWLSFLSTFSYLFVILIQPLILLYIDDSIDINICLPFGGFFFTLIIFIYIINIIFIFQALPSDDAYNFIVSAIFIPVFLLFVVLYNINQE